jgi:hypothetical protein
MLVSAMFYLSGSGSEVDLVTTEFERCLAGQSMTYSLLATAPGIQNSTPIVGEWAFWLKGHADSIIVVPFCLLFGKLMEARYSASLLMSAAAFALIFIPTVEGQKFIVEAVRSNLATNSDCHLRVVKALPTTHGRPPLIRQVETRINNAIKRSYTAMVASPPRVAFAEGRYVLDLSMRKTQTPDEQGKVLAALSTGWLGLYCSDATEFKWARAISVPLVLALRRDDGTILGWWLFNSTNCGTFGK